MKGVIFDAIRAMYTNIARDPAQLSADSRASKGRRENERDAGRA